MEPDAPGMHTPDTMDFEYVISGRVVLELDDGVTVELGPGHTVVQNGTRHTWRSPRLSAEAGRISFPGSLCWSESRALPRRSG